MSDVDTRMPTMTAPSADEPPVTGHAAIDQALARLDLTGPVGDHAAALDDVHRVLQEVLNPARDVAQR